MLAVLARAHSPEGAADSRLDDFRCRCASAALLRSRLFFVQQANTECVQAEPAARASVQFPDYQPWTKAGADHAGPIVVCGLAVAVACVTCQCAAKTCRWWSAPSA